MEKKETIPDEKSFENRPFKIKMENNPLRQKKGRFLINYRFTNNLPEIPCDPKMLLPPLNIQELASFQLTSLEKEMKKDMLLPNDLGIPINALNIDKYSIIPGGPPLDPKDAALLDDISIADDTSAAATHASRLPGVMTKRRTGKEDTVDVTWLLRTKYITNENSLRVPGAVPAAAAAASSSAKLKKQNGDDIMDEDEAIPGNGNAAVTDVERQINAIEKSFSVAQSIPVHPRNTAAQPVAILPILPDELLESWNLVLATFDGDPIADVASLAHVSEEERKNAQQTVQLKSFVRRRADSRADRFVALLVREQIPKKNNDDTETLPSSDISLPASALTGDYQWIREYDSNVRYDDQGQTYLFRVAGDYVGYSDLNTKVHLKKRKRGGDDEEDEDDFLQPEKFILKIPE